MASEDKPDEAADDGMADWAEALLEQKATEPGGSDGHGGVLTGEAPKPFSSMSGAGGDAPGSRYQHGVGHTGSTVRGVGSHQGTHQAHSCNSARVRLSSLDALAGEPMDVLVNGYLIAQGEVVVVNDKFGIRLTDVVTPSERLRRVSKS